MYYIILNKPPVFRNIQRSPWFSVIFSNTIRLLEDEYNILITNEHEYSPDLLDYEVGQLLGGN